MFNKNKVPKEIKKQLKGEKPSARKFWRISLFLLVLLQMLLSDYIILNIARGIWCMSETLLIAFFTKIVAEVVGLVFIAVKYDFSD